MRDNRIQSVSRAIELLTLIGEHPAGISIGNLTRLSGLHKSTVSRQVLTLIESGAVRRAADQIRVQIDPRFTQRFFAPTNTQTLITTIRPFLELLSRDCGEATGLSIPEVDQVRYIDQVSPDNAVRVRDWTGARFTLHSVAPGKLFLAHRSKEEQDHYLRQPLARYTDNTVVEPNAIRNSFRAIHMEGVSWITDEFTEGISAVAAPIFDQQDTLVAAIAIFGPSFRFPAPGSIESINTLIRDYAERCSKQLQRLAPKETNT